MGTINIAKREEELLEVALKRLEGIPKIHVLADDPEKRIGVISFYVEEINHNLVVRMLNDRFGIQVRGGCSCAGTYGHFLLHVTKNLSHKITEMINHGDFSEKPGWVRISFHPTMTDQELNYILDSIETVIANGIKWSEDYYYDEHSGEYIHKTFSVKDDKAYEKWFKL